MARLWEVLKAFEEGKAEKAFRSSLSTRKVFLKKTDEGVRFFTNDGAKPCDSQGISNKDQEADWQIVEILYRKEFRVVQALFKLEGPGRPARILPELFENDSLKDAIGRIENDYSEDTVEVLGAVGFSNDGSLTILVQNGVAIDE